MADLERKACPSWKTSRKNAKTKINLKMIRKHRSRDLLRSKSSDDLKSWKGLKNRNLPNRGRLVKTPNMRRPTKNAHPLEKTVNRGKIWT